MSEWKDVLLSDVATIQQGFAFKSQDFNDTGGIPIIKIKNISSGEVDLSQTQYYTKDTASLSKYFVSKGDILIAMTGSHLDQPSSVVGRVSIMRNNTKCLLNQRTAKIIPQSFDGKIDGMFLYYNLIQEETISVLAGNASGSANQANISSEQIYRLNILLPPLPEQQTIAEVLSSLDDKIDLLHRNNKTLEQMAETLFRQWFVVEAKEEWETICLKDAGKIVCGKTPSTQKGEYFDGPFQFVKIPDMHGCTFILKTGTTLTEMGIKSQANKTIPEGSIMVSCIATVGLVSITTEPCQTNQQINSILPSNKEDLYYLFLWLKNNKEEIQSLAGGGSVTDNLNTTDFGNISIPYPDEHLRLEFNKTVEPLFEKIKANSIQIMSLTNTRDTMLPKLMSGQVRVKTD